MMTVMSAAGPGAAADRRGAARRVTVAARPIPPEAHVPLPFPGRLFPVPVPMARWRRPERRSGDMRKYVIMGVQGSGKGTQSKLLAADLDLVHISVGDIFRWHVKNHTKLGAQVRRLVGQGELVGDDLVEQVVGDRLHEHDWNYGFVI